MSKNGEWMGYYPHDGSSVLEERLITSAMKTPNTIKAAHEAGELYFNTRSVNNDSEQTTEIFRDDKDALIYAHENQIKIDGKDAIAWAIDNDKMLHVGEGKTQRAIDYAKMLAKHSPEMRDVIFQARIDKREGYVAPPEKRYDRAGKTYYRAPGGSFVAKEEGEVRRADALDRPEDKRTAKEVASSREAIAALGKLRVVSASEEQTKSSLLFGRKNAVNTVKSR